jgi:hypothetical protein
MGDKGRARIAQRRYAACGNSLQQPKAVLGAGYKSCWRPQKGIKRALAADGRLQLQALACIGPVRGHVFS